MIYLDNASTYHPKSTKISAAIESYLRDTVSSPGRGGHKQAQKAAEIVTEARRLAQRLFNGSRPEQFHFCANATHGLNYIIQGVLQPGDRVVTTALEHNSVLRPLKKLSAEKNVHVDIVPSDANGVINPEGVIEAIRKNTKLVVLNHASNVIGTVLNLKPILEHCQKLSVLTLVDSSQSAGLIPIDLQELPMDFMVTTGHKALGGPSGTGIIFARRIDVLSAVLVGGTGGNSISLWHPHNTESIFEAGTPNYLGIAGLGAAMGDLLSRSMNSTLENELELAKYFSHQAATLPRVRVYGDQTWQARIPIVSFNIRGLSPSVVMARLDDEYNIVVRAGLQCAPIAHYMLGTAPEGTVRVSMSRATTVDDMTSLLYAIREISAFSSAKQRRAL